MKEVESVRECEENMVKRSFGILVHWKPEKLEHYEIWNGLSIRLPQHFRQPDCHSLAERYLGLFWTDGIMEAVNHSLVINMRAFPSKYWNDVDKLVWKHWKHLERSVQVFTSDPPFDTVVI